MSLKEIRLAAGLTQEELAQKVGTSKGNISKYETGERSLKMARAETLRKLAEACGVTVEQLFDEPKFDYSGFRGALMVDAIYFDPQGHGYLIRIDDAYYVCPFRLNTMDKPPQKQDLRMSLKSYGDLEEVPDYVYMMCFCERKSGYEVKIGRAITSEELEELHISPEDMTEPFMDTKGDIYGPKYRKEFKVVQVKCNFALALERELKDKGIEAASTSAGRINIRIE